MIKVANFEFLPLAEIINEEIFYFPEVEPISLNFQELDYDSHFAVLNLGSIFYMILIYLALILFDALLLGLEKLIIKRPLKLRLKLHDALFWNGILCFKTEIYLELALCTAINYSYMMDSDGFPSIAFSNGLCYVTAIMCLAMPVWVIFFYSIQSREWVDKDFIAKYG